MSSNLNSEQIVRFDANGHTVGTGFALSSRHILTCTHVVQAVCDLQGDLIGQELEVAFPKLASPKTITAKVIVAIPQTDHPQTGTPEDIAVLEICDKKAKEFFIKSCPMKLLGQDEHRNADFSSHGYYLEGGSELRGKCNMLSDQGWIELSCSELKEGASIAGLSGAPLWNEQVSAVTGLVVAEREGFDKAFMIPFSDVLKVWPEFQQYLPSTVAGLLFPEQPDSEFLVKVKENIGKELRRAEVRLFTQSLSDELEQELKLDAAQKLGTDANKIADALVKILEQGGDDVPVINKILSKAVNNCFHPDGSYFNECKAQHDKIEEAIEKILGWLVLASIDKTVVAKIKPEPEVLPAIYFEIPIETAGGVETIVSFQYRRAAVWDAKSNDMPGKNMLKIDYNLLSWHEDETINTLKLQLWNKVFDENRQIPLKAADVKRLNARLKNSRETKFEPAHFYFAVQCENQTKEDAFHSAYKKLLIELSNLTLVRFGWGGGETYFCAYEQDLMDAINLLLTKLRKIRTS